MVKVVVNNNKGLVQYAGVGLQIEDQVSLVGTQSIAAPAATAADATNTVLASSNLVLVTQANNANDRIYLPSPTDVPLGTVITLIDVEGSGYELSSKGDGTTATTINAVAVTNGAGAYAKELAITAFATVQAVKVSANGWNVSVPPVTAAPDA